MWKPLRLITLWASTAFYRDTCYKYRHIYDILESGFNRSHYMCMSLILKAVIRNATYATCFKSLRSPHSHDMQNGCVKWCEVYCTVYIALMSSGLVASLQWLDMDHRSIPDSAQGFLVPHSVRLWDSPIFCPKDLRFSQWSSVFWERTPLVDLQRTTRRYIPEDRNVSVQRFLGSLSRGVTWPECESHHSASSSTEAKNAVNISCRRLHGVMLGYRHLLHIVTCQRITR
jgi:hypothetical protein